MPSVVPVATASPTPVVTEEVKTELTPTATESPSPTRVSTPEEPRATPSPTPENKPVELSEQKKETAVKELFPPVIISIPRPSAPQTARSPEPTATPTATPQSPIGETKPAEEPLKTPTDTTVAEGRPRVVRTTEPVAIKPCTLTVSEETVTLQSGGGDLAVIVGRTDDLEELDGLTAVSTNPEQVYVRREQIAGVKARALFVLRPGVRTGMFQVLFQMPCGKKEIVVRVR